MDVDYFKYCYSLGLYVWNRAGYSSGMPNAALCIRKRNPPCNAEDNLHARYIIIEAWFRGY